MKDIVFNITNEFRIKVKNNLAKYNYSVKSKIFKSSNESYNSIINDMDRIRTLLHNKVNNLKINYSINTIWNKDYNKIIGYQTVAGLIYDLILETENDIKEAINIQNNLINLTNKNSDILLNNIDKTLDDIKKQKYELLGIKKCIENGIIKADLIVDTTYPNSKYKIIGLNVNTDDNKSNIYHDSVSYKSLEGKSLPPLSLGESEIYSKIIVKVLIMN